MEQGTTLYRYQGTLMDFEEAVHHLEHDHEHASQERKHILALEVSATWKRLRKLEATFGRIRVGQAGDDWKLLIGVYCIETDLTLIYVFDEEKAPDGTILVCYHSRQNEYVLRERVVRSCFGEPVESFEAEEDTYSLDLIKQLRGPFYWKVSLDHIPPAAIA